MSASHPDEPLMMACSEEAIINNNDASILNQNLPTIVKEASRVQSLLSESEVDEGMNSYHLEGSSILIIPF